MTKTLGVNTDPQELIPGSQEANDALGSVIRDYAEVKPLHVETTKRITTAKAATVKMMEDAGITTFRDPQSGIRCNLKVTTTRTVNLEIVQESEEEAAA